MRLPNLKFGEKTFGAIGLIVIGAAIMLIIAGILYYAQQERQRQAIDLQTSRTNELIREVKQLSEENKRLNQQNRDYTYCNAILFAKYTQDEEPIIIEDLEKCVFNSFKDPESQPSEEAQSNAQSSLPPRQSQPAPLQPSRSPQTTNPTTRTPTPFFPNTPTQPTQPNNPLIPDELEGTVCPTLVLLGVCR